MRKSLIVVASALLFGVGAADVSNPRLDYGDEVIAGLVSPEQLRPRAARTNYPACRPGRGDDRCIQLYERGVRERLARWDRPTGGWNGQARTARAERRQGPRARQHQRRAHQSARAHQQRHAAHTERRVIRAERRAAPQERHRIQSGSAYGGPVERRTGYPPCGARGGGDNCVQLPERAVRGERTGTPGI